MYSANGTYYTEEHSVSFGELVTKTSDGLTYWDFSNYANTWTDWHLIPSTRPSIENPTIITKFVEIPGADGMLDLTDYLTGNPVYGQRQGSLSFIIDNDHEHWETIREKIVAELHGKRVKMRLMDDPEYYYEGRFTVGKVDPGADHSSISISYQLDPYKIKINTEGSTPMLWDPFNFEKDYDYYTAFPGGSNVETQGIPAGTYYIYAGDYAFAPVATWVSGTVTVKFRGVEETLSSAGSITLGTTVRNARNTLTITGNGRVNIVWRGGSL